MKSGLGSPRMLLDESDEKQSEDRAVDMARAVQENGVAHLGEGTMLPEIIVVALYLATERIPAQNIIGHAGRREIQRA